MKRKFWEYPWAYKEGFAIAIATLFLGFILQLCYGNFNSGILSLCRYFIPQSIVLTIIIIGSISKKHFFSWFSGVYFAIPILICFGFLSLIMGLTPQENIPQIGILNSLGFTAVIWSWPFVLTYFLLLLSLGILTLKRIIGFSFKHIAFYCIHLGLWIILFFAGFGSWDMQRYIMHVPLHQVEWRVFNKDGDILELPIAIELNKFEMEVHEHPIAKYDSIAEAWMIYRAEPKRFASTVRIYAKDGISDSAIIEVNKPYTLGAWKIYQYGYDEKAGEKSSYSTFELVYDPWLIPVYIGMVLLALGSILMIKTGKKEVNL